MLTKTAYTHIHTHTDSGTTGKKIVDLQTKIVKKNGAHVLFEFHFKYTYIYCMLLLCIVIKIYRVVLSEFMFSVETSRFRCFSMCEYTEKHTSNEVHTITVMFRAYKHTHTNTKSNVNEYSRYKIMNSQCAS